MAVYALRGAQLRRGDGAGHDARWRGARSADPERARGARDAVGAVVERLRGRRLFAGKVVDVARRTQDGFARGEALERSASRPELGCSSRTSTCWRCCDGEVLASVPDLIIVLDAETGEPVTTEGLRYGLRVTVIGAPCDERWRTPAGLALVGPRCFGYDHDFVPVEALAHV